MAKLLSIQRIAISGAPARSTALAIGQKYAVTCSVDCWIRQGASNVDAAADTANNWFLAKGAIIELSATDATNQFISVIGTSGSLLLAIQEGA